MTPPATAPSAPPETRLFPYARWEARLPEIVNQYQSNQPYPHYHFVDFLDDAVIRKIVAEFPAPDASHWIQYKHYNENKFGETHRERFPPHIGAVIDEFNSPEFVSFLSRLTGIPNLLADPSLEGGGMHQTPTGGFLNMHADFTMHHHKPTWRRRCNLIVYLNEGWDENWGGSIELWDKEMRQCMQKVAPLLNHALVFNTTDDSFHGYPGKLTCPEDVTRKSLALYYYTVDENPQATAKSTYYRPIPTDSAFRRSMIWIDNKLLKVYSWIKSKLHLSDDFASKILGMFGRKPKK